MRLVSVDIHTYPHTHTHTSAHDLTARVLIENALAKWDRYTVPSAHISWLCGVVEVELVVVAAVVVVALASVTTKDLHK